MPEPRLRGHVCPACAAPVLVRFTPEGRRILLDPGSADRPGPGTYRLDGEHRCHPAEPMFDPPGQTYYPGHALTCTATQGAKP